MRLLISVLLAGGATALAVSAGAQPSGDGAHAILFDQPNFQGSSITVVQGSPDLAAEGFAQRAMSGHFDGDWIACDTPSYGGRCEPVNGDVPNFADIGLSHNLASLRQGHAGQAAAPASDDEAVPGAHLAQAQAPPPPPAGGGDYYDRGGPAAGAQGGEADRGAAPTSGPAGDNYYDRGGPPPPDAQGSDSERASGWSTAQGGGYYARGGGASGSQPADSGAGGPPAQGGGDYYVRGGASGAQSADAGPGGSPAQGGGYYARGGQLADSGPGGPAAQGGYGYYRSGGVVAGQAADAGPGAAPTQGGGWGAYDRGGGASGERAEVDRGPGPPPAAQAPIPVAQVLTGRSVVFFVRPQRSGADVDGQGRGAADQFCRDQGLGPALYYFDTNDRTLRDVLCRRD